MPVELLDQTLQFPSPTQAEADGLLAIGGDLSVERLLLAYRTGIFPWFNEGDPPLWWSPDPRCVIVPHAFRRPRSLQKVIRSGRFRFTLNQRFDEVIEACRSVPRRGQSGTWITGEMIDAYRQLHRAGYAHSFETWQEGKLVGGLYGVSVGYCFCGESMFSLVSESSKCALSMLVAHLVAQGGELIDCQMTTPHLLQFGAEEWSRSQFLSRLKDLRDCGPLDYSPRDIQGT